MQSSTNRLTLFVASAALLVAALAFGVNLASAQRTVAPSITTTPTVVSYQGRVLSASVPFNSTGFFKFAVVNAAGDTTYWSNDGTSSAGSQPSANVPVAVTNGLFTVMLGDTSLGGMLSPLTASVFSAQNRRLRIWFSPNGTTFTQLTPDQQIASVPFALNAETLGGMDASAFLRADRPNPLQIALLQWYTGISTTQSNIAVGLTPQGIAFDGANMWVANYVGNTLSVIRANDGMPVMTVPMPGNPRSLAFDGIYMWVTNQGNGTVTAIRPSNGTSVMTPTVGSTPTGIAFDGINMWVANYNSDTVSVLRASDGTPVRTVMAGPNPDSLAFDGTNMWVTNNGGTTVNVIRAVDGFKAITPTLPAKPGGIAFDGANMWVTTASNSVSVIRAIDGYKVMTPTVGANPRGVAFDGSRMWVVNGDDGTVSVLQAKDGTLIKTVPVGASPAVIAFDGADMWISNGGGQSVSKR